MRPQYNWPSRSGNGDSLGAAATRLHFPPLTLRAGTHLDAHLLSQGFSSCTLPVVRPLAQQVNVPAPCMGHPASACTPTCQPRREMTLAAL